MFTAPAVRVSPTVWCGLGFVLVLALAAPAGSRPAEPASPAQGHDKNRLFNRALGVECEHCHSAEGGDPDRTATYAFARRMIHMVEGLNGGILEDFGGVTCWTCHRGKTRPARLDPARWEAILAAHTEVFTGPRAKLGLTMSVYAASLGVSCEHCHVVGAWEDDAKSPKTTARTMASLFDEIPTYFEAARRPRLQCFMCHQGDPRPERAPSNGTFMEMSRADEFTPYEQIAALGAEERFARSAQAEYRLVSPGHGEFAGRLRRIGAGQAERDNRTVPGPVTASR